MVHLKFVGQLQSLPRRDRFKTRHLQMILAIHVAGSMSGAAKLLNLTVAALSKGISELEKELGDRVFERTQKGIVWTILGEVTVQMARRVLHELDVFERELEFTRSGSTGAVQIGVHAISANGVMVDSIATMKTLYPKTHVRIFENALPVLLNDLKEGRLDLVIGRMVAALMIADFDGIPIVREGHVIIASIGHPAVAQNLPIADLIGMEWCLPHPGTPSRDKFELGLSKLLLPLPYCAIETNSFVTALMLHARMMILSLAPRSLAENWSRRGYVEILPIEPPIDNNDEPIGVIWPKNRLLAPVAKIVRDQIVERIRTGPGPRLPSDFVML
jgi:DNA-binding transcriptional LysR family regulator